MKNWLRKILKNWLEEPQETEYIKKLRSDRELAEDAKINSLIDEVCRIFEEYIKTGENTVTFYLKDDGRTLGWLENKLESMDKFISLMRTKGFKVKKLNCEIVEWRLRPTKLRISI